MKGPWRALFYQGSPEISLAGSFLWSIGGSMRVQEGPLSIGRVSQFSKILRSLSGTLQGPWEDQGWSVTLWESALVSLESLDMFFLLLRMQKYSII